MTTDDDVRVLQRMVNEAALDQLGEAAVQEFRGGEVAGITTP